MKCPRCSSETSIAETRAVPGGIRRRRHCDNAQCGHRISTVEAIVPTGRRHATPRIVVVDEFTTQTLRVAMANIRELLGGDM